MPAKFPPPASPANLRPRASRRSTGRLIAIGDIHGCSNALDSLLRSIEPSLDDTIVTLGDYVDRGPDTRGVLDRLLKLRDECRLIPLLGNHDQMLLENPASRIASGSPDPEDELLPQDILDDTHFAFLRSCRVYYETDAFFFIHANYDPHVALDAQEVYLAMWLHFTASNPPPPHDNGKIAIVGHSSQQSGEIVDLPHLKCLDTNCYAGGWLTAMEVRTGQLWQVDRDGKWRT